MIAASSFPPALWFLSRGAGTIVLLLLTATVVLGIITAGGWRHELWPRFVSEGLHRNLSLLALLVLVFHVVTVVLDPFSHLGWRDTVVPFGAHFRPVWVGLGVLAAESMVALAITSGLRGRIGAAVWRLVHWLGYAAWLLSVVHSLGTGTDARSTWLLAVTVTCVAAAMIAVLWRLASGWPRRTGVRLAGLSVTLVAVAQLGSWALAGPLAPNWAARAGTPTPASAATERPAPNP